MKRRIYDMKKIIRTTFYTLIICGFILYLASPVGAEEIPKAEYPILTTSAGQSPDVTTVNIVCEEAEIKYDYCDVPDIEILSAGVGLAGKVGKHHPAHPERPRAEWSSSRVRVSLCGGWSDGHRHGQVRFDDLYMDGVARQLAHCAPELGEPLLGKLSHNGHIGRKILLHDRALVRNDGATETLKQRIGRYHHDRVRRYLDCARQYGQHLTSGIAVGPHQSSRSQLGSAEVPRHHHCYISQPTALEYRECRTSSRA